MEPFVFILVFGAIIVFLRLIAGSMDRERVEEYLRERGGKLISADWELFGAGFAGDKNRLYRVRYINAAGEERTALCKTKMLSGVYFTDDEPVTAVLLAGTDMVTAVPVTGTDILSPEGNARPFLIHGLDHVQLAMPPGQEEAARRFYRELLGLQEIPKPANLAVRGGVWFASGTLFLHMGVEVNFTPARKAHPALLVQNLPALVAHLQRESVPVIEDEPLEGYRRVYVADPFGNRVELLEPV